MKQLLFIILLIPFMLFSQSADQKYIHFQKGDDANDGLSPATPKKTWAGYLAIDWPSDTVYVAGYTSEEFDMEYPAEIRQWHPDSTAIVSGLEEWNDSTWVNMNTNIYRAHNTQTFCYDVFECSDSLDIGAYTYLTRVTAKGSLVEGSFYFDSGNDSLYVWLNDNANPGTTSNSVFVATHDYSMDLYGESDFLIYGITFLPAAHVNNIRLGGLNQYSFKFRKCVFPFPRQAAYQLISSLSDTMIVDSCFFRGGTKFSDGVNSTISNNTFVTDYPSQLPLLHVEDVDSSLIYNNVIITTEQVYGIFLEGSHHCNIYNNKLIGNLDHGILVSGNASYIDSSKYNYIYNNYVNGVVYGILAENNAHNNYYYNNTEVNAKIGYYILHKCRENEFRANIAQNCYNAYKLPDETQAGGSWTAADSCYDNILINNLASRNSVDYNIYTGYDNTIASNDSTENEVVLQEKEGYPFGNDVLIYDAKAYKKSGIPNAGHQTASGGFIPEIGAYVEW